MTLADRHYREIVEGSGVSPQIAALNFQTFEDVVDVDRALNRNAKNRRRHSDHLAPCWAVTGVDPATGEPWAQGIQIKPDVPPVDEKGKPQKYFGASGYDTQPLFLDTGTPEDWPRVIADPAVPILITEGSKKAACLLSLGYWAISLPGVWCGQQKGELKPMLAQFCCPGRPIILCFDSDQVSNPKVRAALAHLAKLLTGRGCIVRVATWGTGDKGIDDLLVNQGQAHVSKAIDNAMSFEDWQKQQQDAPSCEETLEALTYIFSKTKGAEQAFKLQLLAQRMRVSTRFLKDIYNLHRAEKHAAKPMTFEEFRAMGNEEREWLIGGFLPRATTAILHAGAGIGKTLFMYDLCKAVVTGDQWNGLPTRKGKVLLVQTDEPATETRQRLEINGFFNAVKGNGGILTQWGFDQMGILADWIERERPEMVMIDCLTTVNRGGNFDEKDAGFAHGLYDLRDLSDQYGCAIVVIHHSNRSGGLRGSVAIEAAVSEVWRLRTKEKDESHLTDRHRILEIGKSRSGCSGKYQLELNPDDYSWEYQGELGTEGSGQLEPDSPATLLDFLNRCKGTWFESSELAQNNGFGRGNTEAVRKQLERLHRKGLINCELRVKPTVTGAAKYKVWGIADNHANGASDVRCETEQDFHTSDATQDASDASAVEGMVLGEDASTLDHHASDVASSLKPLQDATSDTKPTSDAAKTHSLQREPINNEPVPKALPDKTQDNFITSDANDLVPDDDEEIYY